MYALFYEAQKEPVQKIETMPGVVCWRKSVAIEKIGLYIPGGTAPLFSTLIMLAGTRNNCGLAEEVSCCLYTAAKEQQRSSCCFIYSKAGWNQ